MLAAMLAILLQTFAVQTHVHAFGQAWSYERSDATASHVTQLSHAELQPSCALCETLARAGRTALAAASGVVEPGDTTFGRASIAIRQAPLHPAHAWRSRAPPVDL